MKIKGVDIVICLLYYAIFKIYALPVVLQQITKLIAIVVVILFLISNLSIKKLFNISIPFSLAVVISSFNSCIHRLNTYANLLNGILYGLVLYCICTTIIYCREKDYIDGFINCFYKMTFLYTVLSCISIIVNRNSYDNIAVTYFLGNKFATSYLFIMFTVLFGIKYVDLNKDDKKYQSAYYLLSIGTIFVSWYVHCTTALAASLILIVMPIIPNAIRKIICNARGIFTAGFLSIVVILTIDIILSNQQVRHIIVDVLKENLSLTGRLSIYEVTPEIVSKSMWFGYGYGNRIIERAISYGNAQNGELEILVNYGIIGSIALLWTIYRCTHTHIAERYWRVYVLTYAMLVASVVEISLGYEFFLSLYIIYAVRQQTEAVEAVHRKRQKIKLVFKRKNLSKA